MHNQHAGLSQLLANASPNDTSRPPRPGWPTALVGRTADATGG
jgi:hypothetical protein